MDTSLDKHDWSMDNHVKHDCTKRVGSHINRLSGDTQAVSSNSSWPLYAAFWLTEYEAGLPKWVSYDLQSDMIGQRIYGQQKDGKGGRWLCIFSFYGLPWGEKGAGERRARKGQRERCSIFWALLLRPKTHQYYNKSLSYLYHSEVPKLLQEPRTNGQIL